MHKDKAVTIMTNHSGGSTAGSGQWSAVNGRNASTTDHLILRNTPVVIQLLITRALKPRQQHGGGGGGRWGLEICGVTHASIIISIHPH